MTHKTRAQPRQRHLLLVISLLAAVLWEGCKEIWDICVTVARVCNTTFTVKITKKDTRDKRKRELSPPSSEDDDLPPMKKVEPKRVPDKKKGNKPPRDAESVCADVSEMKNIGVNRYVGILEFKGKKYLNIREYYEDSGGLKPGKKGVSLVRDQWNNLRESFFDIDEKMVRLIEHTSLLMVKDVLTPSSLPPTKTFVQSISAETNEFVSPSSRLDKTRFTQKSRK